MLQTQTIPKCIITEVHDDAVRSRFAHAHMVSTGEGSILMHDRGVLGLCGGSIPLWIILLVGTKNTVNSPQRLQIYRNRGLCYPQKLFCHALE